MIFLTNITLTRFSSRKIFHFIQQNLYTEQSLGLVGFSHWCEERKKTTGLQIDEVLARIDKCLTNPGHFILTDDLKNALAYGDAFKNFDPLNKLCKFYHEQSQKTKISYFNFGPFAMRFYHKMKQPDFAFNALMDKDMTSFFDQLNSYQICMDLLYESKQYENLLDVWKKFRQETKIAEKLKFPRSLIVLVYGALYRTNTKEAQDFGLKLYSEFRNENGQNLPRKALMFFVGLCMKLKDFELAYELLSTTNCDEFVVGRSMKIILSAKLNRIPEIFRLFQKTIESDLPTSSFEDYEVSCEILQPLEEAFSSKDAETKDKFERYLKLLITGRHVANVSVEDLLTVPLILAPSSSAEDPQELPIRGERLGLPGSENLSPALLKYKDEYQALENFEKFKKAEIKQLRKEKIVQAVAKKIMRDGPFDP